MLTRYDVIVVGAGPAGAEAARRAAELGAHTLLLEKKQPPRPKLCGGCVSIHAQRILNEPIPERLVEARFTKARLVVDGRETVHHEPGSFGVFVDRAAFDAWLTERAIAAGAELRIESARRFEPSAGRVHITMDKGNKYSAHSMVIATGAEGQLVKQIRRTDPADWCAIGIECKLDLAHAANQGLSAGEAHFSFDYVRSGYAWLMHHRDSIYLGIGGLRRESQVLHKWRSDVCERYGLTEDALKLEGHLVPCGGHRRALGKGRVLLAGDAAGFVDAFTGEGISFALRSGQVAAEVLAETALLVSGTVSEYARRCRSMFGGGLVWSLRMRRLMERFPAFLRLLCCDRTVHSYYLRVFAGTDSYPRFFRRTALHLVSQPFSRC